MVLTFRFRRRLGPELVQKVPEFLAHLDRVYLDLAPGEHISFVPSRTPIGHGTVVENEECVKGQRVWHRYTIAISDDGRTQTWTSRSRVCLPGLEMAVNTTLVLSVVGEVFHTRLRLGFPNLGSYLLAILGGTRRIWGRHHRQEMTNALALLERGMGL